MHINTVSIESFRGLQSAKFEKLSRINYFVGGNNCGKTSALEAMVTGGCYADVGLLTDTVFARNQKRFLEGVKNMLIPLSGRDSRIELLLDNERTLSTDIVCSESERTVQNDKGIQKIKILTVSFESTVDDVEGAKSEKFWISFEQKGKSTTYRKDPNYGQKDIIKIPCQFVSFSRFDRTDKILEVLDGVIMNNQRSRLISVLQIFDPKVSNFEVVGDDRQILIFKDSESDEEPLFLNDYGNGMYKAFYMACAALQAENGVLLIDELEAGIHHKALENFIAYLEKISLEQNVQMFITTHSLELLDIARKKHNGDELTIYNIMNRKDNGEETSVRRFDKDEITLLRGEMGVDIR